ncbi:MAG TPA: hypothetical protein VN698_08025, partial [Bacteroidia bacterium]|nr:hypothetical protein [Bacteroidia bacterium]
QNITFIIIAFHTKTDFQINNSFWIWPPFLLAAAIPMLFGFGYRIKNKTKIILEDFKKFLDLKDIFLVTLMGLFFTGSLALYSNGMNKLTHEQQIIGWPIFMVSIIFTSQLWGQIFKESAGATKKYKLYKIFSIILLLVAIVILAKES